MLDGYSASPAGHLTNVNLSPNRYRVRVDGVTGTNHIVGPHLLFTQTNGLHVVFMEKGEIPLSQVTNVPTSIRDPIFAALKPDLLIWHMKEELPGLVEQMEECERWWTDAFPQCDVLYIGTPWRASDTNSTWTLDQNQIVRDIAVSHRRAYADLMQPAISYEWLLSQGYMADAVHLNNAGGQWGADLLWNDLNFFALGLPRNLSLQVASGQARLLFPTAVGAIYALEGSTNMTDWLQVFASSGDGADISTNLLMTEPRQYYRLRLQRD